MLAIFDILHNDTVMIIDFFLGQFFSEAVLFTLIKLKLINVVLILFFPVLSACVRRYADDATLFRCLALAPACFFARFFYLPVLV